LDYDQVTGVFYRKAPGRGFAVGDVAGTREQNNYVRILLDGVSYRAHRLAWFYVHGYLPQRLDHKDKIRFHNWIDNLRLCTVQQNNFNKSKQSNNTTGFKGVCFHKAAGKFVANIQINRKKCYLGLFDTAEEASAAYITASQKHFGEFA
jgi:hypothetical protein